MRDVTTVVLPLTCVRCGRPVEVGYLEHDDPDTIMQSWICPYEDCRNPNTIGVSGTVLQVAKHDAR